jgi:hypothetical protein
MNAQIAELAKELEAHFERHPDAEVVRSLPGLGTLSMPVDGLSAILTGVGDDVAETKGEHDDGGNPKHVEREAEETGQERDRKDRHHNDVRNPTLTEQGVNASILR